MAELNANRRNKLKKSTFGLPGDRKYPMPDKGHAANAKARARQQLNKGNLTQAQYNTIVNKANKVLGQSGGSSSKGSGGMAIVPKKKGANPGAGTPIGGVKKAAPKRGAANPGAGTPIGGAKKTGSGSKNPGAGTPIGGAKKAMGAKKSANPGAGRPIGGTKKKRSV